MNIQPDAWAADSEHLRATVTRLEGELAASRDYTRELETSLKDHAQTIARIGRLHHPVDKPKVCAHCSRLGPDRVPWPCPTLTR